ncbi:thermonuclease family protein [Listeria grandensis]|nr:thermonuclease family protein [Listeria grandensis]
MKKIIMSLAVVAIVGVSTFIHANPDITSIFQKETQEKATAAATIIMPENTVPVTLDRVVDGDTPESVKPGVAVQPYAKEASNYMKTLTQGAKLRLEYDAGGATDKYGRVLAYLYADGKNVNEIMVRKGFARVAYIYKPNTRYLKQLQAAQAKAEQEKLNIWSKPGYATSSGFQE